ncbi:flavodoxin family protein [Peribacillus frigoritolerans]|uniref:flavodoxin family protein n=1 Tax=Peribacillus frigoritolerans TaxID=450367 RepID=UPI001059AF76|nr:flavodoxin family protein [Peribacillus frigoritolerans]TDL80092.1 flavodoxin family protein [Peribacillus frigoritolerans]
MNVLAIYGSSREYGNSEKLASYLLKDINHKAVHLREMTIKPITDQRHDINGFQPVEDDFTELIETFLKADSVVFVTPLYWYGMSGSMKDFFDRWSQALRDERISFKENTKDKKAYVVIAGGDSPKIKALPLIQQFQYIFDFVGMKFEGYVVGEANAPGDIEKDSKAISEAKVMNDSLKHKNR